MSIDDEEDDRGFLERHADLVLHFLDDGVVGVLHDAAGVYDVKGVVFPAGSGGLAIAGDAFEVVDDGGLFSDNPVVEGGFSDVGSAADSDEGPFFLFGQCCSRGVLGSTCGWWSMTFSCPKNA